MLAETLWLRATGAIGTELAESIRAGAGAIMRVASRGGDAFDDQDDDDDGPELVDDDGNEVGLLIR